MPTVKVKDLEGAALDWAVAQSEISAGNFTTKHGDFSAPLIQIHSADCFNGEHGPAVFYPRKCDYSELGWENHRRNPEAWPSHKYQSSSGAFKPSSKWDWGGPIMERERIETSWNKDMNEWGANVCPWPMQRANWGFIYGPTMLIAGMRAFVASKLGDTVDVPQELCQ